MAVVGASLLPYSPMHRPAGRLLDGQSEGRPVRAHCLAGQEQICVRLRFLMPQQG